MKAMILAAGLGTRLRPLTDHRPKALVEINGLTLLEITLSRVRAFGVRDVIINVHHFADMIAEYLKANHNFGMHIEISREDELLDTGGGLKKAAHFFLEGSNHPQEPFIVHNVDVLSTIDLGRMVRIHTENNAVATLAVQNRKTSRYLLFDDRFRMCGRRSGDDAAAPVGVDDKTQALAFCGIHIISPRLLAMMSEDGSFSVITSYLRMAAQGEQILAFQADEYYWRDLGKPENLIQAAEDAKRHAIVPSSIAKDSASF